MRKLGFTISAASAAIALSACQPADVPVIDNQPVSAEMPPESVAYAQLQGADGTSHGRAVFTTEGGGVEAIVSLTNLPSGTHAVHVHETGNCTPPEYTSAGGHWNPTDQPHPMHKGDLGNVTAAADGTATLTATIDGVSLSGATLPMLDADGAALIVHAMADDMVSQPSGAAGARIACAVITAG